MGRRERKYCEKCGCYVPEGETVCVSCGYDPTPKPARRPDPLAAMYARDPWAVAQYHTPLPMDYAQMVNVASRVRQRTVDEVLDATKTENAYAEVARAMNQSSCSTAQAAEAFRQFGVNYYNACQQALLNDELRTRQLKSNSNLFSAISCVKGHMDRDCIGKCDCCYTYRVDEDEYTGNFIRTYKCKKYPFFAGYVTKQTWTVNSQGARPDLKSVSR